MNKLPLTHPNYIDSKSYYKNLELCSLMCIIITKGGSNRHSNHADHMVSVSSLSCIITTIKKSLHIRFVTVLMNIQKSAEC